MGATRLKESLSLSESNSHYTSRFAVLGGGLAGLVVSHLLTSVGHDVVVLEKESSTGGLAHTVEMNGYRFDLGGHRLHSNNSDLVHWLRTLLRDHLLIVQRQSHIFIRNRFIKYPIEFLDALRVFSPLEVCLALAEFTMARWYPQDSAKRYHNSFEDWVVHQFGRRLYEMYFEPYTRKVWGMPCSELSAQWAAQRIKIPDLGTAALLAMGMKVPDRHREVYKFFYPPKGFGMICDALHDRTVHAGGKILTRVHLTQVDPERGKIQFRQGEAESKSIFVHQIISTIPIPALLRYLPKESGTQRMLDEVPLKYRDLIIIFLQINQRQVSQDTWTYFPQEDLIFGRMHEPKNWSRQMTPDDSCTSLVIEVFCSRADSVWSARDAELIDRVVSQLSAIGIVQRDRITDSLLLRIPYAYPIYRIGYEANRRRVLDFLGQWPNLHLVGRTGSFRYLNADGVIEDCFRLIARIEPMLSQSLGVLPDEVLRWA